MSDNLRNLQSRQEKFIEERDWNKFHTPKSLAMAISVESNELLELFQWHDNLSAEAYAEDSEIRDDVKDELADILIYSLSMASAFDLDLSEVIETKIEKNEQRFDLTESEEIRKELSKWKREQE